MSKLVRDKIPDLAPDRSFRTAAAEEMPELLSAKLVEEAKEFQESGTIEELADIYEVILAVVKTKGWSMNEVIKAGEEKVQARGSFSKRIVLLD